MGKRLIPPDEGQVEEVALRGALEERYLAYALSTIMNRALPDARFMMGGERIGEIALFQRPAQCDLFDLALVGGNQSFAHN